MRGLIITPVMFAGLQALNDAQLGELIRRALEYVKSGKECATDDTTIKAMWAMLKSQIDDAEVRYELAKEARSIHARKAAEARYNNKPSTSMHEHARAYKRMPKLPI